MQNLPPSFTISDPALDVSKLERYAEGWLLSGDISQHSHRTLEARRDIVNKLLWFLRHKRLDTCGTLELRQFLAYLTHGHREPGGRWGNPHMTKPVRPRTVKDYHGHLRTLFRWIVAEGGLNVSPMDRIPVPTARADQIQPFTSEQLNALFAAARRGRHPRRDEAILLFLLDTGVRASELCDLRLKDVDSSGRRATVLGKGNKHRTVSFQKTTARALWQYLKEDEREVDDPLFISERGEPFTRSGLLQLIERLGKAARITAVRCSPHTFRHTFAVEFLRAGGNVFTLQQMLGHTSLHMTNRYVALAQADIENQHRQFSPVERLKGGRR
jgi:site-specific recombinase XerD